MKKVFSLLAATVWFSTICAQSDAKKDGPLPILGVHFQYGAAIPAGKLADRFGWDNSANLDLDLLTKTNWIVGIEGEYFFGNNLKEDPLAALRTPEGYLIGSDRELASVVLKERGFYVGGYVGRVFSKSKKDRANGLRATVGLGWMQHKIRIQDDGLSATQVAGEYRKGYDRLTGGPAVSQFVGYQLYSRHRPINFFAGLNLQEGFTKSRRSYDFDLMKTSAGTRFDMRLGLVAGWTLAFYLGDKGEEIYY